MLLSECRRSERKYTGLVDKDETHDVISSNVTSHLDLSYLSNSSYNRSLCSSSQADMIPQFLYENAANVQTPMSNATHIAFLHDVYSVARRLLLTERSITRTACYLVHPMELIPIGDGLPPAGPSCPSASIKALEVHLRHYFSTSYPQLVSSASITSWGRVRPSRPNQILWPLM